MIIAARPIKSVNDLDRVKGVGVTFVAARLFSRRQLPEGFPLSLFATI